MPKNFILTSVIAIFLAFPLVVHAAGFQLTGIGSLDTTGYQYAEWWYMSPNPTLSGIASPNDVVTVSVNGASQTVTADASGNWSAPLTAPEGDHEIVLSSSGGSYSFTLHISSTMPAGIASGSAASTQPVAGNIEVTLAILAIGAIFLFTGVKLAKSHA